MLKKSVYDTIKQGFISGIYKTLRLVKIDGEGKKIVVLPYSKMGDLKHSFDRLTHIKIQLDKNLDPGTYVIECNTGHGNNNLKDYFEVIKKEPLLIPVTNNKLEEQIIDKTEDQENMNNIDFDHYLELVRECEKLKAQNALLLTQMEMQSKMQSMSTLNDTAPKTATDKIFKALEDGLPPVLNILDKYLTQRDKQLELKERELNLKSGTRTMKAKQKINPDEVVKDLEELYDKDQNLFNQAMDRLQDENPNLYEYCCNALGIEEEDQSLDIDSEE